MAKAKHPWLYPAVFTGALMPLTVLVLRAATGTLGAEPVAIALNRLGLLALLFLLLSLACTPVKIVSGWIWPIGLRKTLGLFGFFYACLHFVTYAAVDQGLRLGAILDDIVKRPFILVGFSALVLLVPLAVTSTSRMLKRLGAARWRRLHWLAYVTAPLAVTHFVLRVKKDVSEPAIYGAILATLFAARLASFLAKRVGPARTSRG